MASARRMDSEWLMKVDDGGRESRLGVGLGICSLTRCTGVELLIVSASAPANNTSAPLWLVDQRAAGPTDHHASEVVQAGSYCVAAGLQLAADSTGRQCQWLLQQWGLAALMGIG